MWLNLAIKKIFSNKKSFLISQTTFFIFFPTSTWARIISTNFHNYSSHNHNPISITLWSNSFNHLLFLQIFKLSFDSYLCYIYFFWKLDWFKYWIFYQNFYQFLFSLIQQDTQTYIFIADISDYFFLKRNSTSNIVAFNFKNLFPIFF